MDNLNSKMSFNRRRWSNEFQNSLMAFQSREGSQLLDSLEKNGTEISVDSLDNEGRSIRTVLQNLQINSTISVNNLQDNEDHLESEQGIHNLSNESEKSNSSNGILNLSIAEDNSLSMKHLSAINDIMNTSILVDSEGHSNTTPAQFDHLFDFNKRLSENISLSSDSGTIKLSTCDSNSQNTIQIQSSDSQSSYSSAKCSFETDQFDQQFNLNENTVESLEIISLDSGIFKLSSCSNVHSQTTNVDSAENQSSTVHSNQDCIKKGYFSSPLEVAEDSQKLIGDMDEPDMWDALLALEEALSPFEDRLQTCQENLQNYPQILNRLSQKFKKTPTRFTEKLVSIIEDSFVPSESPVKQGDTSGISLHRMTGEFRKLCKFIEDESMPEWAPSLINTTYFDKTKTPDETDNTSKNVITQIDKTLSHVNPSKTVPSSFATPKNKCHSKVNTPINRFTPSADKSFEYWETVCNMMCDKKSKTNETLRKSISITESTKSSMDEMLMICERQMASLDEDSIIDIRSSEPCKKTDSELKVHQPTRSKSTSNLCSSTKKKQAHLSSDKHKNKKVNVQLIDDNNFELSQENDMHIMEENEALENSLKLSEIYKCCSANKNLVKNSLDVMKNQKSQIHEDSFDDDFKLLMYTSKEKQEDVGLESPYGDDDEQDSSLLLQLAERRQRCLDTAKLMLETDDKDPISSEDNKCLETLYKLGVQDKTFNEVEEDAKFIETLSHCIEYKNYLRTKSKPIMNMLQKFNSPDNLKNKPNSTMKSKNVIKKPTSSMLTPTERKMSTLNKAYSESKNSLKRVQDRKMTPRFVSKSLTRVPSKVEKKTSQELESRQVKTNTKPTTELPKNKTTLKTMTKQSLIQHKKVSPNVAPKLLIKTPLSDQKFMQLNKVTPKVSLKSHPEKNTGTLQSEQKNVSPQFEQKKITSTDLQELSSLGMCETPGNDNKIEKPSASQENHENVTPKLSTRGKLFVTPGKSPTGTLGRKKPQTYFSDPALKKCTPFKISYDNVKSPISLYINGTDTDLIQNVHGRINDRLLTPVSNEDAGKSPKLKFKLSSKENKSPAVNCTENIILPTVRYHSAKRVCLIDDKSQFSPISLTPNSKTKKLLAPIENTVVIQHQGRAVDSKVDFLDSETSIRVQKVAEKATTLRK